MCLTAWRQYQFTPLLPRYIAGKKLQKDEKTEGLNEFLLGAHSHVWGGRLDQKYGHQDQDDGNCYRADRH